MLPELSKETERYLIWLYRRHKINPHHIKTLYRDAERVIAEYVDPKWLQPGNEPDELGAAAVLYVHMTLASNQKDSFAARYCMHALLASYTKSVAAKLG